jgi:erythromycin esterase-like protein
MFGAGGSESWNVRDRHMMETLEALVGRRRRRAVVWAHNTHVGDYRYTSMEKQGSVSLGGLARMRLGEEHVALVGLGTYEGSVVASDRWSGPARSLPVPPAKPGSFEDILHRAAAAAADNHHHHRLGRRFYLLFSPPKGSPPPPPPDKGQPKQHGDNDGDGDGDGDGPSSPLPSPSHPVVVPSVLLEWRGNRAVGVVYDPRSERWANYVPTCLARRYDAFVFFDSSHALAPLSSDDFDAHEVPDTWPTGV